MTGKHPNSYTAWAILKRFQTEGLSSKEAGMFGLQWKLILCFHYLYIKYTCCICIMYKNTRCVFIVSQINCSVSFVLDILQLTLVIVINNSSELLLFPALTSLRSLEMRRCCDRDAMSESSWQDISRGQTLLNENSPETHRIWISIQLTEQTEHLFGHRWENVRNSTFRPAYKERTTPSDMLHETMARTESVKRLL